MLKHRFISRAQLRKLSTLAISQRQKPIVITSHKDKAFAIVDVTDEVLALIEAQEAETQQAKS